MKSQKIQEMSNEALLKQKNNRARNGYVGWGAFGTASYGNAFGKQKRTSCYEHRFGRNSFCLYANPISKLEPFKSNQERTQLQTKRGLSSNLVMLALLSVGVLRATGRTSGSQARNPTKGVCKGAGTHV